MLRRSLPMVALAAFASAAPAVAQTITSGGTFGLAERPSGFNAAAYDSVNKVYLLLVAGSPIAGRLYDKSGNQIGSRFNIGSTADGAFLGWSGVTFGGPANDPAFLVTYTTQDGSSASGSHTKYGRLVRYNPATGLPSVGPAIKIADIGAEWLSSEKAQAAWNGSAFVVGTRISNGTNPQPWVHLFQVNANGGAVVAAQNLGDNADYYGSPAVACAANGTCMVSGFAAGIPFGSRGGTYGRLFNGSTLAPVSNMFYVGDNSSRQENQQLVYLQHTGQFLSAFMQNLNVNTRTITTSASFGTLNVAALAPPFAGWAGDVALAYNAGTQSSLLASKANTGPIFGLFVETLGDTGLPQTGQAVLIQGWDGKWPEFDPTVVPNAPDGQWFVTSVETSAGAAFITGSVAQGPPKVTTNPTNQQVRAGKSVSFMAAATGLPAPAVQWEASSDGGGTWMQIPGATSTTLSFNATMANNKQLYRAHFSNGLAPDALSTAAQLTVKPGAGTDLDGDGKADFLLWNNNTGTWHWATSSGIASTMGTTGVQWGNKSLGDISLTGDIDGDGIADLVIWRASTGVWYWLTSSTGYSYASSGARQWGNQSLGDVPLLADLDGDGRADLAIWRASTGTWYWLTSSSGYDYAAYRAVQWGNGSLGDQPLLGDLDGDGKADLVVWRASTGTWFWLLSSKGYAYANWGTAQWGNAALGDQPLLGDLDGDGKADLTVWRASSGAWYWLTSSSRFQQSFGWALGGSGDVPILR